MKKVKVLFVAEELCTNGAMMSLTSLLNVLPRDKYDITLFLFKRGGNLYDKLPLDITLLPIDPVLESHRLPSLQALKYTLRNRKFKAFLYRSLLIVTRLLNIKYNLWKFISEIPGTYDIACGYSDGIVAPLILRKVNAKKKCSWVHIDYNTLPQPDFVLDALKQMDCCVTVSTNLGEYLENLLQCRLPLHVIHNITDIATCINLSSQIEILPPKNESARIVSVGRVTHIKQFDVIPDVANSLRNKGVSFEWFIIGDGEERFNIEKSIKQLQLENYVYLVGHKSNPMPWVKSADVIVIPSRHEGWGMTVSEALCLGKCVITSDIPVFKEQIQDGINGLMCTITPENLSNAIIKVLTNSSLKQKLESNAIKYPFTKETVILEFDELIKTLL